MPSIDTVAARAKLPADPDNIVWVKRTVGRYLGYRKTSSDGGTWWARSRDAESRKQHYEQLGEFGNVPPSERFRLAVTAAEQWFATLDAGVVDAGKITVRQACEQHIDALRLADGDRKADAEEKRFERLVYPDPLARIGLTKLRADHVAAWRKRLKELPAKVTRNIGGETITKPRTASTLNRDMVPLRAALNRALDRGLVVSDRAWRVELRPAEDTGRRREIYLSLDERRLLLAKADDEIRPFLEGMALLPLRPGALAALTVGDFNARLLTLRIGHDKAGGDRRIQVPTTTGEHLKRQCKGKLPAAPIFTRADGRRWDKDSWKGPIKDAVLAAGLPAAATAYSLRHSTITDLVTGGLDLLTTAQISGTSVAMIERFYGHLRRQHAAKALEILTL